MDFEQAERFLGAARQDYHEAVERFIQCVPREEVVLRCDERADVLAARQVLELAQQECGAGQEDQRRAEEYAGLCERCTRVGPRWVVGAAALCADCAAAAR